MQTGSEHLKAQQRIMQAKNFYNGKIDGIWGPKSIAAKQKWERSGKFTPAIPNNGFPLNDRGPLPKGITRKSDGTLTCAEVENVANAQPVAEKIVVETATESAEVKPTTPPAVQQNQNQQNQNQNQNQQNQPKHHQHNQKR